MNTIISVVILLVIAVIAVGLVLSIGNPIIDATVKTTDIQGAEDDLHFIDSYIRTVAREGKDAVRIFRFTSPKDFESIPGEDAIQFSTDSEVHLVEYLSRSFSGNFVYISGKNADCQEKDGDGDGTTDLVAENDRIKAVFRKVSPGTLRTEQIIIQITEKTRNETVFVGNSSVVINENTATSTGSGYTELSRSGTNLPLCQIHAYVDSVFDYDIYYKLYAGADFLTIEVRNIR